MNELSLAGSTWLGDYYSLSTLLLVGVIVVTGLVRQPARRMAMAWSAMGALVAMGLLCATPNWSRFHLLSVPSTVVDAAPQIVAPPQPITPRRARDVAPDFDAQQLSTIETAPLAVAKTRHIDWVRLTTLTIACGSVVVLLWLGLGAWQISRLCASAVEPPDNVANLFNQFFPNGKNLPRLGIAGRLPMPVAVGLWRPMILLPATFVKHSEPSELRTVLAHELAHIRHRDLWLLAALRGLLVVLWAHPLFWLLRRRVRLDQEMLADAAASEISNRHHYAEQLVQLARMSTAVRTPRLASSVGLWENPSQLKQRIAILLDERFQVLRSCSRHWRVGTMLTLVSLAVGLSLVTLNPAQQQRQALEATERTEKGLSYQGTVINKRTGQPIAGAMVIVRRESSATHPWKILAETEHTTAEDGSYHFTLPPEQVADSHLYIELDVTHLDFAPRKRFGYALGMIRKNESLGKEPFFEHVEVYPAEAVLGTLVTPAGTPAKGVNVLGYSKADPKDLSEYGSFAETITDGQGRFRLNLIEGGRGIIWLRPKNFCPETHVVDRQRGDLGMFTLKEGYRLHGRVLDQQENPVVGVWVNAEYKSGPAKKAIDMPVADQIERSGLTDDTGSFELAPLPPGTYRILPEEHPSEGNLADKSPRPLPAVFVPLEIQVTEDTALNPLRIRAVETVSIETQIYDSSGKPRRGHAIALFGYSGGKRGKGK